MGNRFRVVTIVLGSTVLFAGCAPAPALGPVGQAHEQAVTTVISAAKNFGLGGGDFRRYCGSLGAQCTDSDNFQSSNLVVDPGSDDALMCTAFFGLARDIGATWWRRDLHPDEPLTNPDLAAGESACIESLGVNSAEGNTGQSESVIVGGVIDTEAGTSGYVMQINSVSHPEGAADVDRGYFFTVTSTDEVIK